MKLESKRIFIPNLPEILTEKDVQQRFFKFGNVTSIEIKIRRDLGPKNHSHKFAFVNIDTDNQSLQECFEEFSNKKWEGAYVEVQLAKESFLERLKKEREEAEAKKSNTTSNNSELNSSVNKNDVNGINLKKKRPVQDANNVEVITPIKKSKVVESSDDSTSSSSEDEEEKVSEKNKTVEPDYSEIVVKNNKFKKANSKIEGCGKAPIIVQQTQVKKKSKDPYREQADKKRLNSMQEMKKGYMQQKSAIQAALSNIDGTKSNKIVFNDEDNETEEVTTSKDSTKGESSKKQKRKSQQKQTLFDDDEDDANDNVNFTTKEQFEGKKGKKLFELQTKFNQDERFKLDKRFAEEGSESDDNQNEENPEENDGNLEKSKQLAILGEVLGKTIEPKSTTKSRKTMLRFDPSQPDHSKYEITEKKDAENTTKKKKAKEPTEEKLPEVSQETFYQVSDTLKETQSKGEAFSFLKAFGNNETTNDNEEEEEENEEEVADNDKEITKKVKKRSKDATPFKYDSSDEDDDDNDEKKLEPVTQEPGEKSQSVSLGTGRLWTESFFFKADDYRFQEGMDFIKRMGAQEEDDDYAAVRHKLKRIVKKKVSTFQKKKDQMFRKKIGKFGKKKAKRLTR